MYPVPAQTNTNWRSSKPNSLFLVWLCYIALLMYVFSCARTDPRKFNFVIITGSGTLTI